MLKTKITNRYAKALIGLALSENNLDQISKDLDFVQRTIASIREISILLKSPVVKRDKKRKIIHEIYKNKVSDIVLKFCELVINRQRSELLTDIIKRFFDLRDEHLNIKRVYVKSATEFEQDQIEELRKVLEFNLNKKVELSFTIDKNLIGGFIVWIDDTVIDASLKHQLELLRKKFLFGTEKLN